MATPNDPHRCYALAARKNARQLDAHGQLKMAELADMLSMERTSLLRALNPLQTVGLVAAKRPDSGRSFDVKLSGRGHKKLAQAMPLWRSAQAAFEREVGRDRAVRLRDEILELNSER
jgi:DNA-binding MarR family transcriptional regulator